MAKATLTFGMDLSEFNAAFNKINRQTSDLSQSLSRGISDAMSAYKNGVSKISIGGLNSEQKEQAYQELDKLKQKIKTTTKAKLDLDINDATKKLKGLAGSIIATIGAVKGIAAPISSAVNFEESMADVKKVVDFDSPKELQTFSNEILKLSRRIPLTASELAKITSDGGRLGIAKKNLLNFTELAAKMSVAFEMNVDESGKSIAGLMNIFKLDLEGVEKLGDAMNLLDNTMNTSVPQIMSALVDVGSVGELLNFNSINVTNLAATLTSLSIDAGVASTSMRKFFSVLSSIEKGTKPAREAFETLGIDIKEFQSLVKKDGEKAFLMVFEKISKLDQFEQSSILKNLFGTEHLGTASALVNSLDLYKETIKKTADEQSYLGAIQKEYNARNATTANNIQLLKNNISEIGINIGNVFLPALNRVVEVIQKVSQGIASFATKFPNLTKALGMAVVSTVALNIALLTMKTAGPLATIGLSSFRSMLLKLPMDMLDFKKSLLGLDFTSLSLGVTTAMASIKKVVSTTALSIITSIKGINLAFLTNPITLYSFSHSRSCLFDI